MSCVHTLVHPSLAGTAVLGLLLVLPLVQPRDAAAQSAAISAAANPPGAPMSEVVYGLEDLSTRRWQDAETPTSFEVKKNDRLEVVFRKEGWLRVRQASGPKFGWISADKVTTDVPEGAASATPSFDIEALQRQLQQQLQGGGGLGLGQ